MLVAHRGPLVGHIGPRVSVMTRVVFHYLLLVYDKAHLCRLISNLWIIFSNYFSIFILLVKASLDDLQHKRQSILLTLIQDAKFGRKPLYEWSLLRLP